VLFQLSYPPVPMASRGEQNESTVRDALVPAIVPVTTRSCPALRGATCLVARHTDFATALLVL